MLSNRGISKTQSIVIIAVIAVVAIIGVVYWTNIQATTATTIPTSSTTTPSTTTTQTIPLEQKIKIGLHAPLTGSASPTGEDMSRGATLAVEEINTKGGVYVKELGGYAQIELIKGDDQTTRDGGIAAATRLVTLDKVQVIVGGFSSSITVAASPIAAEYKVPWVVTGSSTPQTTRRDDAVGGEKISKWLFHYQEVGDFQGASISSSLVDIVKPLVAPNRNLRVAFIYQDTSFGQDYFNGFKYDIGNNSLPIDIVATAKFKLGENDFRAPLEVAAAAKPDVIVPMGFGGETIDAITQGVRDLGIKTIWGPVCTCVDDPTYYKNLGKLGEYSLIQTLYSTYATPTASEARLEALRTAYLKNWNVLPGSQGVTSYDAIYIVAKAIENAGSVDSAKIRDALESLSMPQVTLPIKGGTIGFDSVHEVRFDIYVTQLLWDQSANELRPVIVWPPHMKTNDFELPTDYQPGV